MQVTNPTLLNQSVKQVVLLLLGFVSGPDVPGQKQWPPGVSAAEAKLTGC